MKTVSPLSMRSPTTCTWKLSVITVGISCALVIGSPKVHSIIWYPSRVELTRSVNVIGPAVTGVQASSLFLMIGAEPRTEWLDGVVARDERGFVLTGPEVVGAPGVHWPLEREPYLLETSVPGVFAAGDVRRGSVKRVASGVGEGSVAISFVHQYLAKV